MRPVSNLAPHRRAAEIVVTHALNGSGNIGSGTLGTGTKKSLKKIVHISSFSSLTF